MLKRSGGRGRKNQAADKSGKNEFNERACSLDRVENPME